MTGLLIKDWKLLKNQGKFYMVILVMTGFMLFVGSVEYASFLSSYLIFIFGIFTLSTLSYDEYDNGMSYLMSLPVSRRSYATEKYVFGLLVSFFSWILSNTVQIGIGFIKETSVNWQEILANNSIILLMVLFFLGCSLPLCFRLGVEKGRNSSFMVLAAVAFLIYLSAKMDGGNFLKSVFDWLDQLSYTNTGVLCVTAGFIALGLLIQLISYLVSITFMERKEF